ncbi:MAG: Hsp70 family protein [Candidatus Levybacteria bacterium]|nr:Hsp70 family protein [Candidatus Levybacteria bacterium]
MNNQVIQIGIDLGTTNSSIAINKNGTTEVIKNADRDEYAPSVFGIDKAKNKVVGKRAYEKLFQFASEEESRNYIAEVKRLMGTSEGFNFERLDENFTPEEISAEILKYLKESLLKIYPDFPTNAAVITIPAHFSTLQAEATKRAGNLAGFDYVVLLQEPIAAAMAYGFSNSENENWLVYDLGGGTFDVALISSKDGLLSVREHGGDNFLGGKNIDLLIVDKIIVPAIAEKYEITEIKRSNEKYKSVFAKLKYLAEKAKKDLSQDKQTVIEVDGIGKDSKGKEIYLAIDLSRNEFEKLIEKLVDKTIELAKETIKKSGTKSSAVSKVVLVGGPTQIPYIRERLEKELGIEVDSSVDPLTVVARGASIFASSKKIPLGFLKETKKVSNSEKTIKLNYEPMSSEKEEMITGIFEELKDSDEEFHIQIQSDSGNYNSPRIKLKNGKFFDTVLLEEKKTNIFWIYLFDKKGNPVPVNPDSFTITQGLSVSGAPIPHSIGLAVAKKDLSNNFVLTEVFEPFFEKNSILPLKETKTYYTVKKLSKKDTDNALPIKVYEGESDIPNRNTFICDLAITGKDIPFDLPERTEVDITIEVNESREIKVEAFISNIDLTLSARSTTHDENIDTDQLEAELLTQREKLNDIESNVSSTEKTKIEDLIDSISTSLRNAGSDQDEKRKANKELKELKTNLDQLEKEKELPQAKDEFIKKIEEIEGIIEELGQEQNKEDFREQLGILRTEGNKAIENNDKYLLNRVNEQLKDFAFTVAFSNPSVWVYQFEKLSSGEYQFSNQTDAQYYIDKGKKAVSMGDVEEIKRCVVNLMGLLPKDQQKEISSSLSGITH